MMAQREKVTSYSTFRYRCHQHRRRFGKIPTQLFLTREEWNDLRSDPMLSSLAMVPAEAVLAAGVQAIVSGVAIRIRGEG